MSSLAGADRTRFGKAPVTGEADRKALWTPAGWVELAPPSETTAKMLAARWPMGLVDLGGGGPNGARFGFVFQRGATEVRGVRMRQGPFLQENEAVEAQIVNRIRLAGAIGRYAARGYGGILFPCPCLKASGTLATFYEPGFALFAVADPTGKEAAESRAGCWPGWLVGGFLRARQGKAIDKQLGFGVSRMIDVFLETLEGNPVDGTGDRPIAPLRPAGVLPRLEMGDIFFEFLVCADRVVCVKTVVDSRDPVWHALAAGGVSRVEHMPAIPVALES